MPIDMTTRTHIVTYKTINGDAYVNVDSLIGLFQGELIDLGKTLRERTLSEEERSRVAAFQVLIEHYTEMLQKGKRDLLAIP